jgi:hypothetical protein
MITSGSLPDYKNCYYEVGFNIDSPDSGFAFHLMESGIDGTFKEAQLVSISGKDGYLFDQSGKFFCGYESGVNFEMQIFYDHTNKSFSYYYEDVLMSNSLDVTGFSILDGKVNLVKFEHHGNSSASVLASGLI